MNVILFITSISGIACLKKKIQNMEQLNRYVISIILILRSLSSHGMLI